MTDKDAAEKLDMDMHIKANELVLKIARVLGAEARGDRLEGACSHAKDALTEIAAHKERQILELLDEQHFTVDDKDMSLSDWLEKKLGAER